MRGPCADDAGPAQVIESIRIDVERATRGALEAGFYGDPLRPVGGRTYGYVANGLNPGAAIAPATSIASGRPTGVRLVAGRLYSGGVASLGADDRARLEVTATSGSGYVAETESYVVLSAAGEVRLRVRATRSSSFRTRTDLVRFAVEY